MILIPHEDEYIKLIGIFDIFFILIGYTLLTIYRMEDDEEEKIGLLMGKNLPREIAEKIVTEARLSANDKKFLDNVFLNNFKFNDYKDYLDDLEDRKKLNMRVGGKRRLKRKSTKRNKNKKRITKRKR
jgi:hypothetical protein